MNLNGTSDKQNIAAVVGENTAAGDGVFGIGHGVTGRGVVGTAEQQNGVTGISSIANGVWGECNGSGVGVAGRSAAGRGVEGYSDSFQGVYGHSKTQAGVVGESDSFDGVLGISHNAAHAGVSGHNPGGLAGFFEGNVQVTGDISLPNADCAEDFDISAVDKVEQ
jgi:hypothetical protein